MVAVVAAQVARVAGAAGAGNLLRREEELLADREVSALGAAAAGIGAVLRAVCARGGDHGGVAALVGRPDADHVETRRTHVAHGQFS